MNSSKKTKRLMKKAIAVTLGITMAFGALALPESIGGGSFTVAEANTLEVGSCKFTYNLDKINGTDAAVIKAVEGHGDTLEIPSSIAYNGFDYPVVKIDYNFLKNDNTVKTVIFPDSVKELSYSVLSNSSVENIVLPDGLEKIGSGFASNCMNLKSVKYEGTKISGGNMGDNIFKDSDLSSLIDDNHAVSLGNWLIYYNPEEFPADFKPCDLGRNGIKIENIATSALKYTYRIKAVDLEGIKYISRFNFENSTDLKTVINDDSLEMIEGDQFNNTLWYKNCKEDGLIKLGKTLMYYKTDSTVIDITTDELKGIKKVIVNAFQDCVNVDTIFLNSDQVLEPGCFHKEYDMLKEDLDPNDVLPERSDYKIKNIYLDGKKFVYDPQDPGMDYWVAKNKNLIRKTEWLRINTEAKVKHIFDQLDIPFYGLYNDKVGTLSKTEEFYTALKIHDYMSQYQYNTKSDGGDGIFAILIDNGKCTCYGYCNVLGLLMECAGVDCKTLSCFDAPHGWGEFSIGDEWFEADPGWDAQSGHKYKWFALSSKDAYQKDSVDHAVTDTFASWHEDKNIDRIEAKRTIGDIDLNGERNNDDAQILWAYLKGESTSIDKTAADINFDDVVDITDGVLLENFVNGTSVDVYNVPTDGLAPGFKVAFVNGKDYDDIKYAYTDRDGYIVLPNDTFEAPESKKLSYDIGKAGQKVKIHNPYQVIQTKWIDAAEPDYSEPESSIPDSSKHDSSKADSSSSSDNSSKPDDSGMLGDVNGDRIIDIEDAVAIIQHINGIVPLKADEEKRADVSKDKNVDIDDAVVLISYINGNSTF